MEQTGIDNGNAALLFSVSPLPFASFIIYYWFMIFKAASVIGVLNNERLY